MADDDIIRGGLDIVTHKKKIINRRQSKKPPSLRLARFNYLHRVQSLEEKLEDQASLSLNYWFTKFVQEIANKNEIVNSAHRMFTELKKNELAV